MSAEASGAGAPPSRPVAFSAFDLERAESIVEMIPLDRRVVLLGESTHGTEEYYRIRAAVTKRLVTERGFRAVVFEADWPMMEAVNEYTHRRRATMFPDGGRFPLWMWRNQCMAELFGWCKAQPDETTPELFGFDCYSLFESKRAVLAFLKKHDPTFYREVRDRLAFIDKFETGFEYADAMVKGGLARIAGHLQEVLTSIQARLQWGSDKYECTEVERLSVEQNCEVVLAADEYYTKCVSEPAGSQASWNARDQHMTTTLLRIQAHLDDPKIVVWAHNSHIGDTTATSRGGVDFERNETWNLGQMVRATFGADRTWIVGQYTSRGTVTAAARWGGAHSAMALRPSVAASYEAQLHTMATRRAGAGARFAFATAPFAPGASARSCAAGVDGAIAAELRACLAARRTQRWVGVQYHPETELRSHYGEMDLAKCYDLVVYCDATRALEPIRADPRRGGGGPTAMNRRLLKEYRRLMRRPAPGIEAHPLESNLLEWYFVLRCAQAPYAGGEYLGVLEFPAAYPMAPPAFKMLTPSGRFLTGSRLCLSMSDYHPETWNPSWSVETLLVGLQSFMYEESAAIGSVAASTAERERLAAASRRHNERNAIWRELFLARREGGGAAGAAGEDEDLEPMCESVCRFCFSADGDLIAPCMCKGSNEWVHLECLRKWQKQVLLTQPTHPKYQTSIDTVCNVCLEPFHGEGARRARLASPPRPAARGRPPPVRTSAHTAPLVRCARCAPWAQAHSPCRATTRCSRTQGATSRRSFGRATSSSRRASLRARTSS